MKERKNLAVQKMPTSFLRNVVNALEGREDEISDYAVIRERFREELVRRETLQTLRRKGYPKGEV